MRQGPHQLAQKSTSTGRSDWRTSVSKLMLLMVMADISVAPFFCRGGLPRSTALWLFYYITNLVRYRAKGPLERKFFSGVSVVFTLPHLLPFYCDKVTLTKIFAF